MNISALLTGRGNSTLKDKNVLDVLGKSVLYYAANAAKKCHLINEFYCSSDDKKILDIAETIGYKKIVRPEKYALANSQHIDCIVHGLGIMREMSSEPDILVVLLANNVTVKSQWITDCIMKMRNDLSITAVVPVYIDNDHHPLRAKVVSYPMPKGRGLRLVPVARLTPQVFYFNDTCLGHSLVIAKLPIGSFYGGSNPCSPVLLYLHRRYVPTPRG